MTNPPPLPPNSPQPLNYSRPVRSGNNAVWKVILRILAGIAAGVVCSFLGFYLASVTHVPLILFLPFVLVLALAIFIAVRYRRFGYVTGLVIAPFIIATFLFVLLLIVCGLISFHK